MNEIVTPKEYSDICPFSDSEFHEKMEELVKEHDRAQENAGESGENGENADKTQEA